MNITKLTTIVLICLLSVHISCSNSNEVEWVRIPTKDTDTFEVFERQGKEYYEYFPTTLYAFPYPVKEIVKSKEYMNPQAGLYIKISPYKNNNANYTKVDVVRMFRNGTYIFSGVVKDKAWIEKWAARHREELIRLWSDGIVAEPID